MIPKMLHKHTNESGKYFTNGLSSRVLTNFTKTWISHFQIKPSIRSIFVVILSAAIFLRCRNISFWAGVLKQSSLNDDLFDGQRVISRKVFSKNRLKSQQKSNGKKSNMKKQKRKKNAKVIFHHLRILR